MFLHRESLFPPTLPHDYKSAFLGGLAIFPFFENSAVGRGMASILAETSGLELGTSRSKIMRFFQFEPNCWILPCWLLTPCGDQPDFQQNTQELEQMWTVMCAGEHPEPLEFVTVTAWAQEQSPCFWSKWFRSTEKEELKTLWEEGRLGNYHEEVRKLWYEDVLTAFPFLPLWDSQVQLHQLQHCQVWRAEEQQAS